MEVFKVLQTKHSNIEIEKLDYLPIVDRFMDLLVGDDPDVGLSVQLDEASLKYSVSISKLNMYKEILMMVGEAFLLRNEKKNCGDGELSKIISTEISNIGKQKKLIIEDIRIPGLISLINKYKSTIEDSNESTVGQDNPPDKESSEGKTDTPPNANQAGDVYSDDSNSSSN